jgi:vacuolar-type H+-ATPase subunit F/Vma7
MTTGITSHVKEWLVRVITDVLVAAVISGGFTVYFESRLENSREAADAIHDSEQKFDASHNEVVAKVGLYTNELLDGRRKPDKEKILTAIINAQSQLIELRSHLREQDYAAIAIYGHQLNTLSDAVNTSKQASDLKPVYVAVQKLLEDHEDVSDRVRRRIKVSIF